MIAVPHFEENKRLRRTMKGLRRQLGEKSKELEHMGVEVERREWEYEGGNGMGRGGAGVGVGVGEAEAVRGAESGTGHTLGLDLAALGEMISGDPPMLVTALLSCRPDNAHGLNGLHGKISPMDPMGHDREQTHRLPRMYHGHAGSDTDIDTGTPIATPTGATGVGRGTFVTTAASATGTIGATTASIIRSQQPVSFEARFELVLNELLHAKNDTAERIGAAALERVLGAHPALFARLMGAENTGASALLANVLATDPGKHLLSILLHPNAKHGLHLQVTGSFAKVFMDEPQVIL
jgi:hypothetical protein